MLVLDEPVNGLDSQGIRWLRELLRSLAGEGRTILISSHVLAEIEQIADEVVIIHRGKFVEHATTTELAARAAGNIRVRTPQTDRLRTTLEQAGIRVTASAVAKSSSKSTKRIRASGRGVRVWTMTLMLNARAMPATVRPISP